MTDPQPQPAMAKKRRRKLALSPSRASDYRQCPLLYRFRSIDRLPEPSTVPMAKGNLVHAVLEELYGLPRDERTYAVAVGKLKPTWQAMCDKDPELRELVGEADLLEFLVDARALIKGYFTMENPQGFDPAHCEQYVTTILPNGVPLRGFIDRVDINDNGQVRVVDYKTGKKPIPRFADSALFQMKFYALVYWREHGRIPDLLRLMYLKATDDITLTPTKDELEYFERDLGALWQKIRTDGEDGTFSPRTSKLCGWCHFQEYCPAFDGVPPQYPGWPGAVGDNQAA